MRNLSYHRSLRKQVTKLFKGAICALVPAFAVYMGIGLGIHAQKLNDAHREAIHRSDAIQYLDSVPSTEQIHTAPPAQQIPSDASLPIGYKLEGVTQIDGESYAKLDDEEPASEPTSEPGSGDAEVFDSNGHLIMRYQANERADSEWDVTEYLRIPVANGSAEPTGK